MGILGPPTVLLRRYFVGGLQHSALPGPSPTVSPAPPNNIRPVPGRYPQHRWHASATVPTAPPPSRPFQGRYPQHYHRGSLSRRDRMLLSPDKAIPAGMRSGAPTPLTLTPNPGWGCTHTVPARKCGGGTRPGFEMRGDWDFGPPTVLLRRYFVGGLQHSALPGPLPTTLPSWRRGGDAHTLPAERVTHHSPPDTTKDPMRVSPDLSYLYKLSISG